MLRSSLTGNFVRWIDRERRRRRDRSRIFRFHPELLTKTRHRRRHDPLREPFLIDLRDVVNTRNPPSPAATYAYSPRNCTCNTRGFPTCS